MIELLAHTVLIYTFTSRTRTEEFQLAVSVKIGSHVGLLEPFRVINHSFSLSSCVCSFMLDAFAAINQATCNLTACSVHRCTSVCTGTCWWIIVVITHFLSLPFITSCGSLFCDILYVKAVSLLIHQES